MKKYLAFLILLLLMTTAIAMNYPEPTGFVSDYAKILSTQEKQEIETMLEQIEHNTTVEIAVVTVPSLEGMSKEQYAVELFEKWKIGKKDVDNGLLILIAPTERKYRIEVGYGLEGAITDSAAGIIGRKNFINNFGAGKYAEGIKGAIKDIIRLLQKDPTIISEIKKEEENQIKSAKKTTSFFYWILILIFAGTMINSATKRLGKKKSIAARIATTILLFALFWLIFDLALAIVAILMFLFISLIPWRTGGGIIIGPRGGGFSGGFGGGFGGFGGGSSGGGGAGGGW